MALFRVSNERAQFDAAGNDARDQYGAGIRFTQGGNARVTTGSPTNYNQGIPMSATGQVAIVDATAGLPAGTIFHNGLPISGDKVCVSRNATAVVSNGTPYDSAGAVAADINLDLNFIGTDTLNSSVTFTRASSATFTGSNGLIQSATTNTPRFDYDPVTLAAKGLLIEEQRTNLLTYSEQFDNGAGWGLSNATISANSAVAPDGLSTADKLIDDTTNGVHRSISSFTPASTTPHTLSFFAKQSGRNWIAIGNASDNQLAFFNLASGAIGSLFGGATASIQTLTNGWYRCSVTFTPSSTTGKTIGLYLASADGTTSYVGDGTSGAFIWGAQLEAGSFATSYIPTVASQVTRADDLASISTVVPWFNASEGTLFGESSLIGRPTNSTNGFFTLAGGAATLLSYNNSANNDRIVIFDGVNSTAAAGASAINTPRKFATAFSSGGIAAVWAGGAVQTSSYSGGFAGSTSANIGGVGRWNGHIRRITYYPRRLSNAELQAITA